VEVTGTDTHGLRGAAPLLLASVVVVLVTIGFARGFWLSNLHNGLLALTFAGVGFYVLFQRAWVIAWGCCSLPLASSRR